jgi:hypothetical protein
MYQIKSAGGIVVVKLHTLTSALDEDSQLHDPATLPPVPIGYKAKWAPKLVCTLWTGNQYLLPTTDLTLSVPAQYMYSAASHASRPDGVLVLCDFHKVVK